MPETDRSFSFRPAMGLGFIFNLFFIFTITHASDVPRWDLNDVSVLFALPESMQQSNTLLSPESGSDKMGQLFPAEIYSKNSHLIPEDYHPLDTYKNLRAVGMRIDPCFKMSLTQTNCSKQIRIVWQPLMIDPKTRAMSTDDAAIHTFYNLNDTQWKSLLTDLQKLKNKTNISTHKKALSIHPALLNNKTKTPFQSEINEIILKHSGNKNLVRFTFMRLQTRHLWWVFGGFDLVNNEWVRNKIPRVESLADDPVQNFFNEESTPTEMGLRGAIVFSTKNKTESLDDVINGYHQPRDSDRAVFESKLELISKIEDPRKFNPNTMDCVHCHISEPTKNYINHWLTDLKQPKSFMQEMKLERLYTMDNLSKNKKNTRALRSFGYFGSDPHVNQRVINESADVAEQLNSMQF